MFENMQRLGKELRACPNKDEHLLEEIGNRLWDEARRCMTHLEAIDVLDELTLEAKTGLLERLQAINVIGWEVTYRDHHSPLPNLAKTVELRPTEQCIDHSEAITPPL